MSKEEYIYLNPNYIFEVALPNLTELINSYGAGLGGVRILRNKKYQPSLPISIMDDIDEKLTENRSWQNETYDYDNEKDGEDDEEEEHNEGANANGDSGSVHPGTFEKKPTHTKEIEDFKGDELFKQVQMPNSLLHKNWGDTSTGVEDFESNPW